MSAGPVWIDGPSTGRIDPFDRGLTLGDGVFDTLVAFGRIPFAGERHLDRLVSQAASIGIPLDPARVREGWRDVLSQTDFDHAILRTTVTRGLTERGLWPAGPATPLIVVTATPWHARLFAKPVRLVTSSIRRNESSPASRLKSLSYVDHVLAARQAAESGADDALFLNHAGRAACTTIANIFTIEGDLLVTPPQDDGVMPGILRGLVLAAASAAGLTPVERSLDPAGLFAADAVFLTNSVRFLSPAVSLDGKALAQRAAASVAALLAAVSDQAVAECGLDPRAGG